MGVPFFCALPGSKERTDRMDLSLATILHTAGQGLRTPCLLILLLLILISVWQIGDLLVEAFTERRRLKADIPALLRKIHSEHDSLEDLIENSGLLKRQKQDLLQMVSVAGMPRASMIALAQRLLASEEQRYDKTTGITDMVAKLGPMFGLMGTLIPLGPGIVALGQGDTASLAASLGLAFDTTIAGLISAAVCVVISHIRRKWYEDYMVSMESIMDCILEEVAPDGQK